MTPRAVTAAQAAAGWRSDGVTRLGYGAVPGGPRGLGWLRPCGLLLALAAPQALAGPLTGPVVDEGLSAVVEDVIQLPESAASNPLARINVLREAPDGSGRLFVNDLRGLFYVIDGASIHTYFDLAVLRPGLKASSGLASGFVSFALHPEFGSNGIFYTVHSEFVGSIPPTLGPALPMTIIQHSVLTEWTASDPAANSFSGTSRELIRIASPHGFHNLGEIAFNPYAGSSDADYGLLYLGAGDYGSVELGEPEELQHLDTPLGALLRIDPLGGNGAPYSYGIPPSNPFANDGDPGTLDEIYAYGFRNAHRIAWDSSDAAAPPFVSDIGQGNVEEVNALVAGANYGWPEREGTFALDVATDSETVFALPPNDANFGFSYPVAQYDHDEGRAIAGGFVYRAMPASSLYGKFIFGDIVTGRLFYADAAEMISADDGDPATTAQVYELTLFHQGIQTTLLDIVRAELSNPNLSRVDLRFAMDLEDNLYVTTKQDGFIRRLVPNVTAPRLEVGTAAIDGTHVTVPLANTYVSPVVVTSVQYSNNTSPIVARISNVTATSFDIRLQNPSGGAVSPENVSYLVVEEGVWTVEGVKLEAQTYLSTVTDRKGSWVAEPQTYGQSYTNPVVLGQVMSENDPEWSVFWSRGGSRTNPPSAINLSTGKTVAEDTLVTRADETIGFVVFEAGHSTIGGVEFEAGLGPDTVLGVDNGPPFSYAFNMPFGSPPQIAVVTMAGMAGGNGGWAQGHGAPLATATTLFLSVDEDQILDAERAHTSEQVGYVVFESSMVFPSSAACNVPADCEDGIFCNGSEDCVAGSCVSGVPVDCDDGVSCTIDSCNESTESCDNTATNSLCENALFCDGAETCDQVLDCQAGTDPCPGQLCDEAGDGCTDCFGAPDCADGFFCNGAETCVAGSCVSGVPVNCDDGVGCTDDTCNEGSDSCDNLSNCDDDVFCDGAEACDPVLGCQMGTDPCPGQLCVEAGDVCVDCFGDLDCADEFFCNGDETCVGGACQVGIDPCPGQGCDEATDSCLGGPTAQLESSSVTVGGTPVTVGLSNAYVNAVVVCSVQVTTNTTPVVARVSNVSASSFDVRLQNPSGGAVSPENVSCLVVEEGVWTVEGVKLEAQTYLSTVTDRKRSWVAEPQTYGQSYTNPVVLGQVMSENDPEWSVFWSRGGSRTNPPSAASLWTGKEVAEDLLVARADETIGFIVFEAGHGTIGGVAFEAGLGPDTVLGVDNGPPFSYSFNTPFGSSPEIAVVTMAGMDGGNGGWAQGHGAPLANATTLFLSVDEDQIGDSERAHTTEQVGYVVFESPVVFP